MLRAAVGIHGTLVERGSRTPVSGIEDAVTVIVCRRWRRLAAAIGGVRITADYCNAGLDALDFSPVRHGRVLVASVADAIAHLFAELVLVRVLLIRVSDGRTVVPPVQEAV